VPLHAGHGHHLFPEVEQVLLRLQRHIFEALEHLAPHIEVTGVPVVVAKQIRDDHALVSGRGDQQIDLGVEAEEQDVEVPPVHRGHRLGDDLCEQQTTKPRPSRKSARGRIVVRVAVPPAQEPLGSPPVRRFVLLLVHKDRTAVAFARLLEWRRPATAAPQRPSDPIGRCERTWALSTTTVVEKTAQVAL